MRLRKIHIDKYKNLQGDYNFTTNDGNIALIGLNGSGKSNLLEAVSIIFNRLMNANGTGIPFDYSVEYEINGDVYTRAKGSALRNGERCRADELLYPSSIISCYSGEDKRLWETAFESYYNTYFDKAVNEGAHKPRLLYVNKYCWKIALISLLCSDFQSVRDFLKGVLAIDNPSDITISFKIDERNNEYYKAHPALSWFKSITNEQLTDINANVIATTDVIADGKVVDTPHIAATVFNFLYLLSLPQKNDKNKIDKLIDSIDIKLGNIDFNDLSEGQKKMILVECITQVLGDENSLVLLDEPDAHSHVAMKKDLLKIISGFKGQTIFTTHSPMFLNKRWEGYKEENIFYINDGKIESTGLLRHMTELTDNAVDYFEGAFILSSKYILVVEGPYDKRYLEKAIQVFTESDKKYGQLSKIAIIPAGNAGNTHAFYEQVLKESMPHIDRLVFLYDYDAGGYQGWKKTSEGIDNPNVSSFFYQADYTNHYRPSKEPDQRDTILAEDYFSVESYADKVNEYKTKDSYKDFRNINERVSTAIKTFIEKHYQQFPDEYYKGFRPVLDMLLNEFNL